MKQAKTMTNEADLDAAWEAGCQALAAAHSLDQELVSGEFFPVPRSEGPAVQPPAWLLKGVMTRLAFEWDPATKTTTLVRPEEWTAKVFAALKPGGSGLLTARSGVLGLKPPPHAGQR